MITISGPLLDRLNPDVIDRANRVVGRLAEGDPTLWGPEAEVEARIRLGWLHLPQTSRALLDPLKELAAETKTHGLTRIVLCGMGGSSLAPEVIAASKNVDLVVLDSTDPHQVAAAATDLASSVVIVASKSGSTIETDSQRRFFVDAFTSAGLDPRQHIIIVTDPGSPFDESSRAEGYRVINADPNVGGRFSALSAFGLTPTALLGLDPAELLDDALDAHNTFLHPNSPAVLLAVAMAEQTKISPVMTIASIGGELPGLGDWIEQLVAESTGKQQQGVLPVIVESDSSVDFAGDDRLSIAIGASPNADLSISAPLGAHFLLWEWATALAGYLLQIDPFNQPNVTESKTNTGALLKEWGGQVPAMTADAVDGAIDIFGATSLRDALESLLATDYLAVMAYLDRQQDGQVAALRQALAAASIRRGRRCAVTFGWGPRFLHSTGQFHKGGPQVGSFLQITGALTQDQPVPGAPYSFGTLQLAQALGDVRALSSRGRPVVRLHLRDRHAGIDQLLSVAFSL